MCSYNCFQIELMRGYNYESFHEDLKKIYHMTGVKDEDTVFLFTDTQVRTIVVVTTVWMWWDDDQCVSRSVLLVTIFTVNYRRG